MPTFKLSGRYTSASVAAVRQAGYANREAAMKQLVEELGGKFIAVYWVVSPDMHFELICELPSSDQVFLMISNADASGALLAGEAIELRSSAQADAAIAQQTTWKPPGQS